VQRTPAAPHLDDIDLPVGWVRARVAARRQWRPGLVSLTLDDLPLSSPAHDFVPGQAFSLGLPDADGHLISRPYCACSTPGAPLQFFVVMVPDGSLSPRLVSLEPGSLVALRPEAEGDFTLAAVPDAPHLWLIATGTGLAPFMSMLHTAEPWHRFERIVLVHAVREATDLACREELAALEPDLRWVPVVSREDERLRLPATDDDHVRTLLHGRVTTLLQQGALEAAAGLRLTPDASQVLLCGNPGMVTGMTELLAERGLRADRPGQPGQVRGLSFW